MMNQVKFLWFSWENQSWLTETHKEADMMHVMSEKAWWWGEQKQAPLTQGQEKEEMEPELKAWLSGLEVWTPVQGGRS